MPEDTVYTIDENGIHAVPDGVITCALNLCQDGANVRPRPCGCCTEHGHIVPLCEACADWIAQRFTCPLHGDCC